VVISPNAATCIPPSCFRRIPLKEDSLGKSKTKMSFPLNMKTGFGEITEDHFDVDLCKRIGSILTYFMTKAIDVGAVYVKAAGRDTLTTTDILYALQYQAQHFTDTINEDTLENFENEMESEEEDSEEEESEEEEEEEEEFTRAESTGDPTVSEMNRCHDTWDEWNPQNHIQVLIKRAVDDIKMKF
jgi:hypothetical protein